MKAKVIETGEIVEVEFYCSAYYKEKGQGPDRREWDEDELEFIPNPNRPKMVSLDKVCEWIKANANKYMYFDEGAFCECIPGRYEWYDDDECIEDLRKQFE